MFRPLGQQAKNARQHRVRTIVGRTQTDEGIEAIENGRAALARGAWAEARARFAEALAAARYELDAEAAFDAHERGYRLARSLGDAATSARLAIQLCHDAYAFRGRSRESPAAGVEA